MKELLVVGGDPNIERGLFHTFGETGMAIRTCSYDDLRHNVHFKHPDHSMVLFIVGDDFHSCVDLLLLLRKAHSWLHLVVVDPNAHGNVKLLQAGA
ncbi:hypothetical protein RZS08_29295, partial [Arthrospira platensis SPKY1]|nr:hypothetical protein [Arthrospira platensis SPKY1]